MKMRYLQFAIMLIAAVQILLSELLFAQWHKESINDYLIHNKFPNQNEVSKRNNLGNTEKSIQHRSLNKDNQLQMPDWMPTNGPYGGSVSSFARIFEAGPGGANFIFVGLAGDLIVGNNGGRIFRSQDGENWTALNNFPTSTGSAITSITSIPTSPSGFNLYASSDQGWLGSGIAGVYRSTDYGDTWNPINSGLVNADISSLAVIGTTIFAGNYSGGVFRSTNFGDNWTLLPGLTNTVITLMVDGTNIIAGTTSGVFISKDTGDSWKGTGLTSSSIESLAITDSYIFAGTYNNGIFRSSNYGIDWFSTNNGLANNSIPSIAVNGTNIYASNFIGGVYLSTNYGDNWIEINNGLITPNDYTAIGPLFLDNYNGSLYAGSFSDGIFRLVAGSADWSPVNAGLTGTTISAIVIKSTGNESFLFAGCKNGRGRNIFRSTNRGEDWLPIINGLPSVRWINALMYKDDILFAGLNAVFRSTDNGDSWMSSGLTGLEVTCFTFNEEFLFAGTVLGGVHRSTDDGSSWTSTGLSGVEVSDLAILGDYLFATTIWDGILKSTDDGINWSTVFLPTPYYLMLSLAVVGSDIFAGTVYGVLRSTDNGANWMQVNNGLPEAEVYEMAVYENNLFAASSYGVFLSTNFGSSWSDENEGLENYSVSSIGILEDYLYAATVPGSIWRRPLSEMIVPAEPASSNATPSNYLLSHNYPNPFNPSTRIKYQVSSNSHASLVVYDILGNEIETLVNEEKTAGTYEVTWYAEGLPSGVYFYQLKAGDFIQTKKMILMK